MKARIIETHTTELMTIEVVTEVDLEPADFQEVADLLTLSFGEGAVESLMSRPLPTFRLLCKNKEGLIGHLAAEHRRVRTGRVYQTVLGVSDICIHPDWQGQGLGAKLINTLQAFGRKRGISFLLSFADNPAFYEACGFEKKRLSCRWVFIHQGVTMGVLDRTLDGVMIKAVGAEVWPEGELDLLGHIF